MSRSQCLQAIIASLLLLRLNVAVRAASTRSHTIRPGLPYEHHRGWRPELGPYSYTISTTSTVAQEAFDRGLNYLFNFNQWMAREAFLECAAADPGCAMCKWGTAYAWGPFLNAAEKPLNDLRFARQAVEHAWELAQKAAGDGWITAKELGLIRAMLARYPEHPTGAMPTMEYKAFEAELETLLGELGSQDMDVAVLLAEAKMDIQCDSQGYHFLDASGHWTERSQEAADLLYMILDSSNHHGRLHPMAAHLLIHLTEGGTPEFDPTKGGAALALDAANALISSMASTQASHLQHMPVHTLMRTGRYAEAVRASVAATSSDGQYLSEGQVPYGPGHNLAAGIIAASMSGMSHAARDFGSRFHEVFSAAPDLLDGPGGDQAWNLPLTTPLRLGLWAEVLEAADLPGTGAPPYPRDWPYAKVLQAFVKGTALARAGELDAVDELGDLLEAKGRLDDAHLLEMAGVAELMLRAAVKLHILRNSTGTVGMLKEASTIQTSWGYGEPPRWHQPIHDCLGQVLLEEGEAVAAEKAFRTTLSSYPEGAFSLWGLRASLAAQQSAGTLSSLASAELSDLDNRIDAAWAHADVALNSACPAFSRADDPAVIPPIRLLEPIAMAVSSH